MDKEHREKDEKKLNDVKNELKGAMEKQGGKTREAVNTKGDEVKATVVDVGDKLGAKVDTAMKEAVAVLKEEADKNTQELLKTIEKKVQLSHSRVLNEGDIPASISLDKRFASVASTAASTEATEEVDETTKYSKLKSTLGRFNTLNIPFSGRKL